MRCIFGDPKNAPPPLKRLSPEESVSYIWNGEGSLVEELLLSMVPHVEEDLISDLKLKIRAHDPLCSDDIQKELQQSLLWWIALYTPASKSRSNICLLDIYLNSFHFFCVGWEMKFVTFLVHTNPVMMLLQIWFIFMLILRIFLEYRYQLI